MKEQMVIKWGSIIYRALEIWSAWVTVIVATSLLTKNSTLVPPWSSDYITAKIIRHISWKSNGAWNKTENSWNFHLNVKFKI